MCFNSSLATSDSDLLLASFGVVQDNIVAARIHDECLFYILDESRDVSLRQEHVSSPRPFFLGSTYWYLQAKDVFVCQQLGGYLLHHRAQRLKRGCAT